MNEKLIKLSSSGNGRVIFIMEVFILSICFLFLILNYNKLGVILLLIGFLIIFIYFLYSLYKIHKIISLYKDSNNEFYIKKIFTINEKSFIKVKLVKIKKYMFFPFFILKIKNSSKTKIYYTYSYKEVVFPDNLRI